jgi:ABC-type polar amino acid transport system ATPase subunit
MIIVTHNMDFARTIADYVIFIEAGKIVEAGEKAQVFGHPKEKRTQEFLRLFSKSQFE